MEKMPKKKISRTTSLSSQAEELNLSGDAQLS
jgi:hypothetical protein